MRVVHAGVDVTRDHGRAAAGDPLRLEGMDLAHVPLESREGVAGKRWSRRRGGRVVATQLAVVEVGCEVRRRHGAVDALRGLDVGGEVAPVRARDRDTDLRVVVDELPAGALDRSART